MKIIWRILKYKLGCWNSKELFLFRILKSLSWTDNVQFSHMEISDHLVKGWTVIGKSWQTFIRRDVRLKSAILEVLRTTGQMYFDKVVLKDNAYLIGLRLLPFLKVIDTFHLFAGHNVDMIIRQVFTFWGHFWFFVILPQVYSFGILFIIVWRIIDIYWWKNIDICVYDDKKFHFYEKKYLFQNLNGLAYYEISLLKLRTKKKLVDTLPQIACLQKSVKSWE